MEKWLNSESLAMESDFESVFFLQCAREQGTLVRETIHASEDVNVL